MNTPKIIYPLIVVIAIITLFTACEKENIDTTTTQQLTEIEEPEIELIKQTCGELDIPPQSLHFYITDTNEVIFHEYTPIDSLKMWHFKNTDSLYRWSFNVSKNDYKLEFHLNAPLTPQVGTFDLYYLKFFKSIEEQYYYDTLLGIGTLSLEITEKTDSYISGYIQGFVEYNAGELKNICIQLNQIPLVQKTKTNCFGPFGLDLLLMDMNSTSIDTFSCCHSNGNGNYTFDLQEQNDGTYQWLLKSDYNPPPADNDTIHGVYYNLVFESDDLSSYQDVRLLSYEYKYEDRPYARYEVEDLEGITAKLHQVTARSFNVLIEGSLNNDLEQRAYIYMFFRDVEFE